MFQNLANYLLSSVLSQQTGTAEGVEGDSSIKLKSKEENEWIIVDKDISDEESDEEDLDIESIDYRLTRSSSASSLPRSSNMEESWFVTPPPCFTSTGPVVMRTSPLENLLIEHPSMSVYHIHPRRQYPIRTVRSASSTSNNSQEEEETIVREEVVEEVRENAGGRRQVAVEARLPRLNRVQVLRQQEAEYFKSRQAQKAQVKKACKSINRGKLQRNNKAREVNCRNQRHRRKERSQGAARSYASNNRKC